MLRDAGLAHAQDGFQVADTGFLRADDQQDLDAGRLADQREEFGDLFFGRGYIRGHEYIIPRDINQGKFKSPGIGRGWLLATLARLTRAFHQLPMYVGINGELLG